MKKTAIAALAILLAQAASGPTSAASDTKKFVRSWAACDELASERGFGRNNTARFSRGRFIRKCRRGTIA